MSQKIIYYYQTFTGLNDILNPKNKVTHIHLSSFHFGNDENNNPYLHLNDFSPDNPKFNNVWKDIKNAKKLGIKIIMMLGGAGGAYTSLFENFDLYYQLLKSFIIKNKDIIDGIDLDIEENVGFKPTIKLIKQLKTDFPYNFIICMAPIQSSLQYDIYGIGGFCYKDLYLQCGNLIDYFNTQFYEDYSIDSFTQIIKNGYPNEKIVIGSISSQNLNQNLNTIKSIINKYPNFGGVYNWEYFDSPPNPSNHPGDWSLQMNKALQN